MNKKSSWFLLSSQQIAIIDMAISRWTRYRYTCGAANPTPDRFRGAKHATDKHLEPLTKL